MQAFLAKLLTELATKLGSWLVARASEFWAKREAAKAVEQAKEVDHAAIDARLAALKKAYLEANDGTKATPDQRTALQRAISEFARNAGSSKL